MVKSRFDSPVVFQSIESLYPINQYQLHAVQRHVLKLKYRENEVDIHPMPFICQRIKINETEQQ